MVGTKSLVVALISAGLGAATLQMVHAANLSGPAGVSPAQKLDDDNYPHMRKALHDLRAAKESLQDAEPRFHDHRDRAIEHVDQAIKQVEDGLAEG